MISSAIEKKLASDDYLLIQKKYVNFSKKAMEFVRLLNKLRSISYVVLL